MWTKSSSPRKSSRGCATGKPPRCAALATLVATGILGCIATTVWPQQPVEVEVRRALGHSPMPPAPKDPTNPAQGIAPAESLGRALFNDTRLSGNGTVSCATCHQEGKGWSDGLPVPAAGKASGVRRTPSIRNVAHHRWFNWDGSADTLWSQVLGPIESPGEMAGSRLQVAQLVSTDASLAVQLVRVFGDGSIERCAKAATSARAAEEAAQCFRYVGQALAAYVSTIASRPNRFDSFVAQVKAGTDVRQAGLSSSELDGLRIFFGRGNCASCHTGPMFTNGEFHNLAIYPTVQGGWKDAGRLDGVRRLLLNEFNVTKLGLSAKEVEDMATPYLQPRPSQWGQFKTPSLRNAAVQNRFMHHGQFASLEEVVRFYSDFVGMDMTDHHRELSIMPLRLTDQEQASLVAFLRLIGE
jgi:cytochrome c peroxidase